VVVAAGARDGHAWLRVDDACGLAIARGLVEAHAGHIEARNHGPGCRFEILLPLAPANSE
jgi:nitrogen-specific signal transduction histidine kinase